MRTANVAHKHTHTHGFDCYHIRGHWSNRCNYTWLCRLGSLQLLRCHTTCHCCGRICQQNTVYGHYLYLSISRFVASSRYKMKFKSIASDRWRFSISYNCRLRLLQTKNATRILRFKWIAAIFHFDNLICWQNKGTADDVAFCVLYVSLN